MTPKVLRRIGAACLVIALMVAALFVGSVAVDPVRVDLEEVSMKRAGLSVAVVARLAVTPRVRVTFERVDGELRVGQREVEYVVRGLNEGDVLQPNTPQQVSVEVKLSALDVASILLRSAQAGKVQMKFEGTVYARVLGIPLSAPVSFDRAVGY